MSSRNSLKGSTHSASIWETMELLHLFRKQKLLLQWGGAAFPFPEKGFCTVRQPRAVTVVDVWTGDQAGNPTWVQPKPDSLSGCLCLVIAGSVWGSITWLLWGTRLKNPPGKHEQALCLSVETKNQSWRESSLSASFRNVLGYIVTCSGQSLPKLKRGNSVFVKEGS